MELNIKIDTISKRQYVVIKQIVALTKANLKSRYRGTWTGLLWVIFNPLIMYGVQSLVFKNILKMEIPNYSLFLLSGLLPWLFIVQTLDASSTLILNNGKLLKSYSVDPRILVAAQVVDNIMNFSIAFFLLLFPTLFYYEKFWWGLVLIPFPMIGLLIGVVCLSLIASITQVFFRDLKFVLGFILSVSFFLTPVFYSEELIPQQFRWMVKINVFYYLLKPFRTMLYDHDLMSFFNSMASVAILDLALVYIVIILWRKTRSEMMFYI